MTASHDAYWFNTRTGEVEHGKQSIASELVGPFDTAEAAAKAPERLAENAAKWAREEAAEEAE